MESLKQCPFCGSTNISAGEIVATPNTAACGSRYLVQTACLDCQAAGPVIRSDELIGGEADRLSAVAWNRRADTPVKPADRLHPWAANVARLPKKKGYPD